MKSLLKLLFLFFSVLPSVLFAQMSDPFHWDVDLSTKKIHAGESIPLEVTFLIPPKHYLYKEKMDLSMVEGDGFKLGPLEFSPSIKKNDPFTGQEEDIFEVAAVLKTTISSAKDLEGGETSLKLLLTYQGCSDSLCFRLMKKEIELPVQVKGDGEQKSLFMMILLAFLGGLASDFTPCVLPIIPITLAFIGIRKGTHQLGKNFFLSLLLVLSMSFTYALMGLLAAVLGKSLGFLFQNPYFLSVGVILFVVFALSLFGLFEIQVPLKLRNRLAKVGGTGVTGSILAGLTVGFLAAPCVGPLIASLLLYVAHDRNLVKGFILLFSYGLGMGSLFLVIGTFYHRLANKIHGGPYMVWIKRIFAVLLLIPAYYYGSIVYGHFKKQETSTHSSFWIQDVDQGFAKAQKEGKSLFIDFYASWCFPCVEMEKGTFSDPELQKFIQEHFIPIKVDCTEETPQCKKMVDRYSIIGWPTFLITDSSGQVKESFIGQSLSPRELQDVLSRKK